MTIRGNFADTSGELIVQRINHGIKLVKPDKLDSKNIAPSLDTVLQQKFNIWFSNTECALQNLNEACMESCGLESLNLSVGKTASAFMTKESANFAENHDKKVILTNKMGLIEFEFKRVDGPIFQCLTIKLPWYNDDNQLIGTFGCGILLNKHSLADSITQIAKLGLLNTDETSSKYKNFLPGLEVNSIYFSKRETECLHLTIRGKTAKQVAHELKISPRTVEEYLANIKIKMGVSSKSELIEKGIDFLCNSSLSNDAQAN